MIGSDGKVAQMGAYKELSQDSEGAFAKLMEWQLSGGKPEEEAVSKSKKKSKMANELQEEESEGELTEEERMRIRLEEHDESREVIDVVGAEEDGEQWEKVKIKSGDQNAAETVVEKTGLRDGGFGERKGY